MKTIIAIGKTEGGATTTTYAPIPRRAGEAIGHAVGLWSGLVLAVGQLENAKRHMMPSAQQEIDRLINDFNNTLQDFETYWIGEIKDGT